MKGIVRPKAEVLDERALVPERNIVSPPPNEFTHELNRSEPFYFGRATKDIKPDGEFSVGTRVLLAKKEGDYCHVIDKNGLYVEVLCESLRKL